MKSDVSYGDAMRAEVHLDLALHQLILAKAFGAHVAVAIEAVKAEIKLAQDFVNNHPMHKG